MTVFNWIVETFAENPPLYFSQQIEHKHGCLSYWASFMYDSLLPISPYVCVAYIEDIYFFEVNTKYISSSELKTSKFSRVFKSR